MDDIIIKTKSVDGEISKVKTEQLIECLEAQGRTKGILSDFFGHSRVFVAGISGGSYLIEKMSRQGITRMTLCDPGRVKRETLSRTSFTYDDAIVARSKVNAMADRIRNVHSPHAQLSIATYQCEVQELDENDFAEHDLIIAGTDSLEAQAFLSDMAVNLEIPFLAIGIHSEGRGGHILWRVPEDGHACYRCGLPERFATSDAEYDLWAEPASVVDIQSIDMMALRVAMGILDRNKPTLMGQFYEMIRDKGYAVVGNHPDYEYGNSLVDALFSDLPDTQNQQIQDIKRHAFLGGYTVWLESAADEDCPICGSAEQS